MDNQELELGGWKEQFKEALRSIAPKEDAKRELKRHEYDIDLLNVVTKIKE